MSPKKWGFKAAEFFAEWIVYIVQQTVHKLSGAEQLISGNLSRDRQRVAVEIFHKNRSFASFH